MKRNIVISALLLGASLGVFAQNAADNTSPANNIPASSKPVNTGSTVQRDVNQQQRIENGLKDGSLTTGEAARLERDQSRIDRLQAKELQDGKLSPSERKQLQAAQNRAGHDIAAAEQNGAHGHPQSASSQRMQADVQRNLNQDRRIEAGVQNGSLTNREVATTERGQARVDHQEAVAGADGHVSAAEQERVQQAENRQSAKIHHQKHDAQERKS